MSESKYIISDELPVARNELSGMAMPEVAAPEKFTLSDRSPSYKAGRNALPEFRGLMNVAQGPLMGFADEAYGGIAGGARTLFGKGSFSDNYAAERDFARGASDDVQENSPWTAGITQAMASAPLAVLKPFSVALGGLRNMVSPMAAVPAAQTAVTGLLSKTLGAAKTGFGYGAVNGVGKVASGVGSMLRLAQSGYIRNYAAWVVVGAILAIGWIGLRVVAK